LQFLAIILTTLALIPGGAHLFVLPNKIAMSQADYFTVQGIYRGWALFGIVVVGALIANLLLTWRLRGQGAAFRLALAAFLLVGVTLAIFFIWTQPANVATQFWTVVPGNWQALRLQWEYAHAASAILTFAALCSLTLSLLVAKR
jgi:hypothetical protein